MSAAQPRLAAQALYPQTGVITQMPLSQPRMATIYPQGGVVPQSVGGQQTRMNAQSVYQQTASVSQASIGGCSTNAVQAVYRPVAPLTQNRSATQPAIGAQIIYPQSVQVGSQMPSVQNRVSMVQNTGAVVRNSVPGSSLSVVRNAVSGIPSSVSLVQNNVAVVQNAAPVVRNTVPVVRNNVPMVMSASPVIQNMGFQQGRQFTYQSQINPPRQQFAFQGQIASNVQAPVLSPVISNVANPFQHSTVSQIGINQVITQPLVQQNIVPRLVQMNPVQSILPKQTLLTNNISEVQIENGLYGKADSEDSVAAERDNSAISVLDNDIEIDPECKENESEAGITLSPCGLEPVFTKENSIDSNEGSRTDIVTNDYNEITLDDNLISDAQFGMRSYEKKISLEEPLLLSSEQNSPLVTDNATSDTLESSTLSNMVNTSDIEELLLFPSSFDTESSQNSQASLDFKGAEKDLKDPGSLNC